MSNMDIYDAFRNTPPEAKKTIKGGRLSGFTDINPMYRIQKLTEQFGPCGIGWYYDPVNKWTEQAGEEILCFVDINLYVKNGNEWSKPIAGTGGSTILVKETKGLRASDEGYKMATTDALSVACKQLGIGADVYWAAGESKYSKPEEQEEEQVNNAPENRSDRINSLCLHHNIKKDTFDHYLKTLQDDGHVARKTVKMMTDDEFVQMLGVVHQALNKTKAKESA
jgi:hypothetical protein